MVAAYPQKAVIGEAAGGMRLMSYLETLDHFTKSGFANKMHLISGASGRRGQNQ